MPENNYLIPAEVLEKTLIIKKSRFIAFASLVTSREEAKVLLQSKKDEYPDARHHCWAYLIGDPMSASFAAMNDAGEPSGTAGKPILSVIQHKKIGNVMVVISRYFGGIKLGAGGLTRAYSAATEQVMSQMKLCQHIPTIQMILICDFSQEQSLRYWSQKYDATISILEYAEQVKIQLCTATINLERLKEYCVVNKVRISEILD